MIKQHRIAIGLMIIMLILSLIPVSIGIDSQLTQMLKVTITVFALARALNAILSVAQGTELSIEPMGVGLTLKPGEVLDPLNDLIEQFASILLLASASLGIQQIIIFLSDKPIIQFSLSAIIFSTLIIYLLPKTNGNLRKLLFKIVMVLTLLRLLVPVSVLVSYQVQSALSEQRAHSISILENTRSDVQYYNQKQSTRDDSWWQSMKNNFNVQKGLNSIQKESESAVDAAVYLLAEFVLVMVLLPIFCLYLFIRLFNQIMKN